MMEFCRHLELPLPTRNIRNKTESVAILGIGHAMLLFSRCSCKLDQDALHLATIHTVRSTVEEAGLLRHFVLDNSTSFHHEISVPYRVHSPPLVKEHSKPRPGPVPLSRAGRVG